MPTVIRLSRTAGGTTYHDRSWWVTNTDRCVRPACRGCGDCPVVDGPYQTQQQVMVGRKPHQIVKD